jgi:hypothetical protein
VGDVVGTPEVEDAFGAVLVDPGTVGTTGPFDASRGISAGGVPERPPGACDAAGTTWPGADDGLGGCFPREPNGHPGACGPPSSPTTSATM